MYKNNGAERCSNISGAGQNGNLNSANSAQNSEQVQQFCSLRLPRLLSTRRSTCPVRPSAGGAR